MTQTSEIPRNAAVGNRRSAEGAHKWGPIFVATDASEGAFRAVDAAGALAAELNADLWIADVIDGTSDTELTQFAHTEGTSIGDVTNATALRVLDEAVKRAEARGAKKIHTIVRAGDCTEEIIEAARQIGATAIFVGRRGSGRLKGLLIGSVSQKLACLSPSMLVIVP